MPGRIGKYCVVFNILKHPLGNFSTVRLINNETGEYLEVLTDFGAGVNDLVIRNAQNQLVSVIDGYRTEDELINDHHSKFKGSKLSPFPNRIPAGKYQFNGIDYQLPINEVGANNNLHAFLHNRPFEILDEITTADFAKLKLGYNYRATDQGYPFCYQLTLTYTFDSDGLEIQTEIENSGEKEIPMADGWHPYFRFDNLDHVNMKMTPAKRVSSNVGNALNGGHEFDSGQELKNYELDDCFHVNGADQFKVELKDVKNGLALEIWQESTAGKYKYMQIYTPPNRKTIAIEPVTCEPNAFNTGNGLIILKPNERVSMSFGIKNKLLNN